MTHRGRSKSLIGKLPDARFLQHGAHKLPGIMITMKRSILLLTCLMIGACSEQEAPDDLALRVADEVERLANARSLWPNFDPTAIPLAIYDGKQTYLFRHPDVPEGFAGVEGNEQSGLTYTGRHPAVTANTSADIGGALTATLLVDNVKPGHSVTGLAGVALHEAFHVFQREQHPAWAANEGDLFMYPIDKPNLLALRRLETKAVRRALDAADPEDSECWSRQALAIRAERFSDMDAPYSAYERGTELNEGLATYVQFQADGQKDVKLPEQGFAAVDVRPRAYATGAAFALLLDRVNPDWPALFESDSSESLDAALLSELGSGIKEIANRCAFTNAEVAVVNEVAQSDVARIVTEQNERRVQFDESDAWRLVVKAADGEPLWPQRFDPLNVERIDGGIIHTRFLRLGNDRGYVEVLEVGDLDIEALTVGAGPHPMFNGVKEVSILGLPEYELGAGDGPVSIRIPGLEAEFEGASISRSSRETIIYLRRPEF